MTKKKIKTGLAGLLRAVNAPGADDGRVFTDPRRRRAVIALAKASKSFKSVLDDGFSLVYGKAVGAGRPVVLISCHIDHPFEKLFIRADKSGLTGTLDNSVCAGLLLDLMRRDRLPAGVLAAFTGNEERGMRGARVLVKHLRRGALKAYAADLAAVITLDVTPDNAGLPVSLENAAPNGSLKRRKGFETAAAMAAALAAGLKAAGVPCGTVLKALPDESHAYRAAGLSALSFCLPVNARAGSAPADVHDPKGVRCSFAHMRLWQKGLAAAVAAVFLVLLNSPFIKARRGKNGL